jgi:hypothetical protein
MQRLGRSIRPLLRPERLPNVVSAVNVCFGGASTTASQMGGAGR